MPIVCRFRRQWKIKCPPCKKHVVGGMLVPTMRGALGFKKTRLVSVEIHGRDDDDEDKNTTRRHSTSHLDTQNLVNVFRDDDFVIVRILKPRKHWGLSRDHDDSSDDEEDDDEHVDENGWVEYRKYHLESINHIDIKGSNFEARFGDRIKGTLEVRELCFHNRSELEQFNGELTRLRNLEKERAKMELESFRARQQEEAASQRQAEGTDDADPAAPTKLEPVSDQVKLLVEIVSAINLPICDGKSSDPFIVVYCGRDTVHRTGTIHNTLNPIWTVANGSLFILHSTAEHFFKSTSGLSFEFKDHDGIGGDEIIGDVLVSHEQLLNCNGERKSYEISLKKKPDDDKYAALPMLNLRVRKATDDDFDFMKQLRAIQKSKKEGVYADASFVAPLPHNVNFMERETKPGPPVLYRVKPGPDPSRNVDETKWLSKEQLTTEAMKPSTQWIETGSGALGKLFFEVISCDGLPNKDQGGLSGKTDAFCCVIYEDAIVNTDVINDTKCPRWMPWSQRAFIFHMMHPSSQILLGVFDYDSEGALGAHDTVGRISIDVTNFRADTDYMLSYDLFDSTLDSKRKACGTIKVRLRIQWQGYRKAMKSCLSAPPDVFINLPQKQAFQSAYFVVNGEENPNRFDMDAIHAYRQELEGYVGIVPTIKQAIFAVVFWRFHYKVDLGFVKFRLPMHSVVCFLMATLAIENLNYIPAFGLFCVAWLLLATNEQRQGNPSPWYHSLTFPQMWYAALVNNCPPVEISDHENEGAIIRYERKRAEEAKIAAARLEAMKKQTSELDDLEEKAAVEEVDDEDVTTKVGGGPSFHPLKPILFPIQKILGRLCISLRIIGSIVTWDESQFAFIVTNACILGGLVLLWVPWSFFIRWTMRIIIWVGLGPWMKLVDIFYISKAKDDTSEAAQALELLKEKGMEVVAAKNQKMIQREERLKYHAMKRYMFGKYVVKVPQYKQYRFRDVPKADSFAKPHVAGSSTEKVVSKKHGQKLVGHMIHAWNDANDYVEEQNQEKAKRE